jgi:hypothetical protein
VADVGTTDLSGIEAQLQSDVGSLQAEMQSMESTLNGAIANDVTGLQNQIGSVQALLEQQVTNGVNTAEQFATGLVSGLGLGGITSTLTSLASRLSAVETETTECLDPLCDTVTPQAKRLGNLGKYLADLEALGIEALLLALAAECMTDPGAVVSDVSSVVNDVGGPMVSGIRDLIGA